MTYRKSLTTAAKAASGILEPVGTAIGLIGSSTMVDPAKSNGVELSSAIAHMKRAQDRIDSALEHLEAARLEQARLAAPEPTAVDGIPAVDRPQVTPFTPRVIASGVPPVTDYPDRPA